MIKVYIASKIKHAARWRKLREEWAKEGIDIHARWIDQAHLETDGTPSPEEFLIFWMVDEHDVKTSLALIVYGEEGEELRGALIEAGIAIGSNIIVFVVGDSPSFGSWVNHARVVRAASLEFAKTQIKRAFIR